MTATIIIDSQMRSTNPLGWIFRGTNVTASLRDRSGEITPVGIQCIEVGVKYSINLPGNTHEIERMANTCTIQCNDFLAFNLTL